MESHDKKYEFNGEVREVNHPVTGKPVIVRQIRLLRPIGHRIVDTAGGWLESQVNLSDRGTCWVGRDAVVIGNASVSGDALISARSVLADNATVTDNARVLSSTIIGNAFVTGNAEIYNRSQISDNAMVSDNAVIGGAVVSGNASIDGGHVGYGATVTGTAHVSAASSIGADALIEKRHHVISIIGLTSDEGVTIYRTKSGGAIMVAGCQTLNPWMSNADVKKIADEHEWHMEEGWEHALTLARVVARRWRREFDAAKRELEAAKS